MRTFRESLLVKIIKVLGALGLLTDFLFHWIETRTVVGFLIDGFYDVQLELGGAWGWGASFLALGAHVLFVFGFLALIALPLKIEEMNHPWDGLKQVVEIKDSLILTLLVSMVTFAALAVTFKSLGMWPFDATWLFSE